MPGDESAQEVPRGCECDCINPYCTGSNAPVAYVVERGGTEIRICTHCQVSDDTVVETLVGGDTPAQPYMEYDPMGALVLGFKVTEP